MPHKNQHNHYLPTVGTQPRSVLRATCSRVGGHISAAGLQSWHTWVATGILAPAPAAAAAARASPLANTKQRFVRLAAGPGAGSETPSGAYRYGWWLGGSTVLASSLLRT